MTLTSGNTEPNIEKENSKSHENEQANDKERLSSNKQGKKNIQSYMKFFVPLDRSYLKIRT